MTYGPNTLFELIIPITCTLLGAGFTTAWLYLRQYRYLGWTALAMLAFSMAVLVQLYNMPPALAANSAAAATLYLTGAWAAAKSIESRMGVPGNPLLAALTFACVLGLMIFFSSSLERYRVERFYTMNLGVATMLMLPFWRMLTQWPKQPIDRFLLVLFWLMSLQFVVRTLLTLPPGGHFSDNQFVHSLQWQVINVTMFIFTLLFSLALLGASVVDLTNALREERNRDPLTRVLNRRGFDERLLRLRSERSTGARGNDAGSILMLCDLDHFKKINDSYGHAAGDAVLCAFAELLGRHLRNGDLLGRYGGEEFVALAPGIGLGEAHARAREICAAMTRTTLPGLPADVRVTVSIGVVQLGEREGFDDALQRADALMYRAKNAGRNRVVAEGDALAVA